MYGTPEDFRGTSPYFRDRRDVSDSLRRGRMVELMQIDKTTEVQLIEKRTFKNQEWLLVITPPLSNVPRSLFERSQGNRKRFIGWVKADSVVD